MDVNPYESPRDVEEPSLPPPTMPGPIWREVLYLAITAFAFFIAVPTVIVLVISLAVRQWM